TAAIAGGTPVGQYVAGDFERRIFPAEFLASRSDLVIPQRRTMRFRGALLVGCALADDRLARHQRWPGIGLGRLNGAVDILYIVSVTAFDMPAGGGIAGLPVFTRGKARGTIDGNIVVVPQYDKIAQLEMPGKPDRLVVDTFHQATIARNDPGTMIYEVSPVNGIQMAFCDRHAHGHGQALPQRTGCGFHSIQEEVFRMAGTGAPQLAEIADLVERRVGISR